MRASRAETSTGKGSGPASTADAIRGHVESLQQRYAALEAEINPLKDERDAFIAANREVYDTERRMAEKIKALQEEAVPIAMELKALRELIAGKPHPQ